MVIQASRPTQPLLLELPHDVALTVTADQFTALATANRDLRLERTAAGELIVNPPTGGETGHRNLSLSTQLGNWFEDNDKLGKAFDSSTGFKLPNGAIRSPDAAWVRMEHWEGLSPEQREGFIPLCPDFVIELRSNSDRPQALRDKMQEYMDNGTQMGWLIDPQTQQVAIYRAGEAVEVLENPHRVLGETILPGFTLSLQRIFP